MDIVEELRRRAGQYDEDCWHEQVELDAAEEILFLRHSLKNLLDVFEKCELGNTPHVELRIVAIELAKSALRRNK